MKISFNNGVLILIMCVFGADEDGVKRVSVMEGDSVTLDPGFTEKIIKANWKSGDDQVIADLSGDKTITYTKDERFRDRLKLNNQTGSLTINNMRITDTGVYHLQIDHSTGFSTVRFNVTVYAVLSPGAVAGIVVLVLLVFSAAAVFYYRHRICDPKCLLDEENNESDKEEESVALKTDTEKQTDEEKLKLDHQTGSLKTTDSGDYKLQIKPCSEDEVNTIFVEEGNQVTLNPDTEVQKDDVILWMFGDQHSLIAQMSRSSRETFDGPDGRFRGRLKLDEKTGSLTVTNIKSEHTGCYKLQIGSSSRGRKYKTFKVITHDEEKTESDKEEESVALKTDTEKKTDEEKTEFAKEGESVALKTDTEKQTDEEKLELDHQTRSLKTTDSEDYKLQIKPCSEDEVNTIFVEEGNHVTLNPDTEIQRDDVILWMFGDQGYLIVQMTGWSRKTFDGPDGRFRGRLKLDEKTGSLTITNIKSEHTGCYKLQISSSSRGRKYKTFKVITHGSRGKNANETLDIQLLSKEDPDRSRVLYTKAHPTSAL